MGFFNILPLLDIAFYVPRASGRVKLIDVYFISDDVHQPNRLFYFQFDVG